MWGQIIAGGLGLLGGILGNKDGGKQQNVTTTQEVPEWVRNAMQWNIDRGQSLANQPYTPYPGQRLAGFNPTQQNAFASADLYGQMGLGALGHSYNALTDPTGQNMMGNAYAGMQNFASGLGGAFSPLDAAQGRAFQSTAYDATASDATASLANRGAIRDVNGGSFLDMDINSYLNPYTQSVIQNTTDEMERARQAQLQQGNSAAVAAGAFGGSRHGVSDSLTNAEFFRNQGNMANAMNAQAYDAATGLMGSDLQRALQAGMANQGMDWNVENLNANLGTQTSQFNAANQTANSQFNAGNRTANSQFNAGNLTNVSLQNAGMQNQMGMFNANDRNSLLGLQLQALSGMGGLGNSMANYGLMQGNALQNFGMAGVGAQQAAGDRLQAQSQLGNDWDYSQFLEARDWYANRSPYGIAPLQGQTFGGSTTQPYFGPSNLQAGLGGAMMGLGAYNAWNAGRQGAQGTVPGQVGQYGPNYGIYGG